MWEGYSGLPQVLLPYCASLTKREFLERCYAGSTFHFKAIKMHVQFSQLKVRYFRTLAIGSFQGRLFLQTSGDRKDSTRIRGGGRGGGIMNT